MTTYKTPTTTPASPEDWLKWTLETLDDKQALDVCHICVKDIFPLADYMVFASGTSIRHLQTLSDAVERMTKNHKAKAVVQGRRNDSHWIVLGLPCIFLHLFLPEARLHYQLEKIWQPIQT